MAYKINGHTLVVGSPDGTAPSDHDISYTQQQLHETISGTVSVDPPSGIRRIHTWSFDRRSTRAVDLLMQYLDLDNSPVVVIDTYDVRRDGAGTDTQLTGLVCVTQRPALKTEANRKFVGSFQLVFTEAYPQS